MKAEIVYDIWLALAAGQSLALPRQLLEQFGSAKVLYENRMSLREMAVRLTGEERKAFETLSLARPERIAEQCERDGTRIVALPDEGYPERLREIYDPPAVLYLRGEIGAVDRQIALAHRAGQLVAARLDGFSTTLLGEPLTNLVAGLRTLDEAQPLA